MPPALIEGFESYVLFTLMIIFYKDWMVILCQIFSAGVTITIIQRAWWAYKNIK